MAEKLAERGHRKERVGEVISNRMDRTIVVRVRRRTQHPRFRKIITVFSKCYVDDPSQEAQVGDEVRIRETRPLSKTKCWRLVEVIHRRKKAGVTP